MNIRCMPRDVALNMIRHRILAQPFSIFMSQGIYCGFLGAKAVAQEKLIGGRTEGIRLVVIAQEAFWVPFDRF